MKIRKAGLKDAKIIVELITALAIYEKAEEQLSITLEQIIEDGFQEKALFDCLLAEVDNRVVGFALFYKRYSTWKGKSLYLEDLFVLNEFRGQQIGKKLFLEVAQIAKDTNCQRFEWQVLDWNQTAIDFYKSMGATLDSEWINCKFDSHERIVSFVQQNTEEN